MTGLGVPFEFDLNGSFFFPPVQSQDAMGRNAPGGLAKLKIVLVIEPLTVRQVLALSSRDFARLPQYAAHGVANLGGVGDLLGQNVLHSQQDICRRCQSLFRKEAFALQNRER